MKVRKLHVLIACILTLAAILSILALVFVTRTPRSAVNKFFTAYIQCDAESIMKMVPETVRTQLLGPEGAQEEALAAMQQRLQDSLNYLGSTGFAYSFKATNVKDIEGEDLAAIQQNYADTYGYKVSAAKTVEVRVSATANGETTDSPVLVRVIRIGMTWYLDIFSFSNWIWF